MKNLKSFTSFISENFSEPMSLEERIDVIFHHYLVAALWSSTDPDSASDTPLDTTHDTDDFTPEALATLKEKVSKFVKDNIDILDSEEIEDSQVGHSLWLTQNRHGAGFFDLHLDKANLDKLTQDAQDMGTVNLFINDNNQIDIM